MVRFLELAWDALRNSAVHLVDWFREAFAAGQLDPRGWPQTVWLVVGLAVAALLLMMFIRRRRLGAQRALPEMMISHGEIITVDDSDANAEVAYGMAAPPRASHRLSLTLSNLNPWPVQLLELAVRTRGLRQPVVAEAGSVVPPNGAVDVVAELFDLPGDVGVVELFLYTNRGAKRTYRLSAPLEWEPWDKRYRIRSLSARVTPVKSLASQQRRRFEKRSYQSAKRRERQKEFAEATWRRAERLTRQLKERRVASSEGRVAALAGERLMVEPLDEARPTPASNGAGGLFGVAAEHNRGSEGLHSQPPRGPQKDAEQGPPAATRRERLDFPDEF